MNNSDYYWREYTGVVPLDAFPAIQGGCNGTIYIAQGYFEHIGILPAGLYLGTPYIVATAQHRNLTTSKHLKVLCTPSPFAFRWVKTTTATFENLKLRCELVHGGVETDMTMYIGRQLQNGKKMMGKIYRLNDGNSVLTLPANNPQNEIRYTEYDVLTYNCRDSCAGNVFCDT